MVCRLDDCEFTQLVFPKGTVTMGYNTRYELNWEPKEPAKRPCRHCGGTGAINIEDAIQEFADTEKSTCSGECTLAEVTEESCKWYDHEAEMKDISRRFPSVLFTLRGEGEESGDVWVKYFKNGKMQSSKAEIKLDPFDPKKLK